MESYKTHNTCSRQINFEVQDNIITKLEFIGGCAGNARGVSVLAVGRSVDDVIALTRGIQCRLGTSCPDQLAIALEEYKAKNV